MNDHDDGALDQLILENWARVERELKLPLRTETSIVITNLSEVVDWPIEWLRALKRVRNGCAHGTAADFSQGELKLTSWHLEQALGQMLSRKEFQQMRFSEESQWKKDGRCDRVSRRALLERFDECCGDARLHRELPDHIRQLVNPSSFYGTLTIRDQAAHPRPPPLASEVSQALAQLQPVADALVAARRRHSDMQAQAAERREDAQRRADEAERAKQAAANKQAKLEKAQVALDRSQAAQIERERLDAEAAQTERDRLEKVAQTERDRLDAEAAQTERDRLDAEAAQIKRERYRAMAVGERLRREAVQRERGPRDAEAAERERLHAKAMKRQREPETALGERLHGKVVGRQHDSEGARREQLHRVRLQTASARDEVKEQEGGCAGCSLALMLVVGLGSAVLSMALFGPTFGTVAVVVVLLLILAGANSDS